MAIIVHHLNNSRSQRILWLLEELGVAYDVRVYARDAVTNLAPPELLDVHPLGKSPMLEADGRIIIESGAIVEYLCARYDTGTLVPALGTDAYIRHLELMHFAEGSAMTPILLQLYTSRLGEAAAPLQPRIVQQLDAHFDYLESELNDDGHFIGSGLSAADIMLSFPAEIAVMQGKAATRPKLSAFVAAMHARDAWQRAAARGEASYYTFT